MTESEVDVLVRELKAKKTGPILRKKLVREHGSNGIRALLATEHATWNAEVVELDAPDCPWPQGLSAGDVARKAFGPLARRLPKLVEKLGGAEHVVACRHTSAEAMDLGGFFLVYALKASYGSELWVCGAPDPQAKAKAPGWDLPEPLRELYTRHNGLGVLCAEFGWTGFDPGVQPSLRLAVPDVSPTDAAKALSTPDLFRFTRGTGENGESGWCFTRNQKGKGKRKLDPNELSIQDLDASLGVLGEAVPFDFWGFLDRYLTGDKQSELPVAAEF